MSLAQRFFRRTLKVAAYSSVTVGGLLLADHFYYDSTGRRTLKAFYTSGLIGYDYGFKFNEKTDIAKLHETNATRLYNLLTENKGLYIKLGQNIANQAAIFPPAFQDKFSKLYDSAPTDSWDKIDETLKQELGEDYMMYFQTIDKTPIASASIAQVHKAVLVNGQSVALKVQHPYIANQLNADLLTYKIFNRFYEYYFEIPISFTSDYIALRMNDEVDFIKELKNSTKVEKLIQNDSYLRNKIHIPKTYPELSTSRVLTAEWCDGEPLLNYQHLKKTYNTTTIMKQYLTLFSKMIFEWGFIHSDPHPGNLLVRFNKKTKAQELVLLDHGLYVELNHDLRLKYCLLWKSLFELNDKELKKIAVEWGIGSDKSDMFASFSLLKPYNNVSKDFAKMTAFEKEDFRKEQFKNFFKETEKFPLELIFLGRTMRMLQLLNQKYGAPVNRINLFSLEAVRGYYLDNILIRSPWQQITSLFRYSVFLLTMTLSDLAFYLTKLGQYLFNTRNIEDVLQEQMFEQMKKFGVENPKDIDIFSG